MKQKAWTALLLCAGLILSLAGCGGSQYGDFTTEAAVTHYAEIQVEDYGTITLALDGQAAPETVANFVALAEEGFYDGLTFHRIIEGFVIQGGDPNGDGTGGSDTEIKGEFRDNKFDNPLSHVRGAVSMARSQQYNSASSQFFIVHQDSTDLDGAYAVFGYVTEGMDVVDAIVADAQPTDRNGSIQPEDQPVITAITVTEA
ncbi:MAG: peptidylprolyl isomerase [Ruminiclostridium sp.]|nr:peptidylprolyl isomerase [Ruminiclostridium sp.]